MRTEMTNYQLMLLRDDLKAKSTEPAFYFLLKTKIEAFWKQNKMILEILNKRTAEIKKKYCILGEDGEPVTVDVNGKKELQYATDEAKAECSTELTEFLNRSINVEL